jgi:hypothetical protein
MAFDLAESETSDASARNRWIAVYIGILAVILAIAGVGSGNATKDATAHNIEASNLWAFFQAKNIRRHELRLQIAEFEVLLAAQPDMPETARQLVQANIEKLKENEGRYTSEPETGEGTKELMARAVEIEKLRDIAMRKDPYFDYGQAFLQIAIVLASVAIIAGGGALLLLSGVFAAAGIALTLNGFFLFAALPLVG